MRSSHGTTHNPHRRRARWALIAAVALYAADVVALVVGTTGGGSVVATAIGSVFAPGVLIAVMAAVAEWSLARKADRQLEAFRRGNCLAHWRYSGDEWRSFAAAELERRQKRLRWAPLWAFVIWAPVSLMMIVVGTGAAAISVAASMAVGWVVGRVVSGRLERAYAAQPVGPFEAYIGRECAFLNGRFLDWTATFMRFAKAEWIDGAPPMLQLTAWGVRGGHAVYRVPVPKGQEDAARKVMATVSAWCRDPLGEHQHRGPGGATNPYRAARRWSPVVMVVLIGVAVLAVQVLGDDRGGPIAILAVVGAFFAGLSALVSRSLARKTDVLFQQFWDGKYLAHWKYTPEEWRGYSAAELARARKLARWGVPLLAALFLAPVSLPIAGSYGGARAVAIAATACLAVGWVLGRVVSASATRRYSAQPGGAIEAYVGREGAILNGRYMSLHTAGLWVTETRVIDGAPATLQITTRGMRGSGSTYRIPVPKGREAEAERVGSMVR